MTKMWRPIVLGLGLLSCAVLTAMAANPFGSTPIAIKSDQKLDGTPGLDYLATWVGTVDVDTSLNVRSGPWGQILGQLSNNDKVKIVGREGDWYKIIWRGQVAYCHTKYVNVRQVGTTTGPSSDADPQARTGRVNVNTSLNIRAGPWGEILGQFHDGDRVKIIGEEGDWYKISWNGRTAYCHKNYISVGGTSTTPTPGGTSTSVDSAALNAWKGGKLPPAQFARLLGPAARESMKRTGIPASVTLAQAALETGWGKATIGDAKNLFGVKGTGPAGSITVPTKEYINGRYVTINDKFRKYHTWTESIDDHARVLQGSRYRNAFNYKNNPDQFAREIHKAGYATSPSYANTLISIMKQYNLYQYDKL